VLANKEFRKIVFYLPNLSGGGVERAFLELAQLFLDEGVSVDLVIAQQKGEYIDEIPNNVRVIVLSATSKFSIVLKLYKYLASENFDAFLSGGNVSNILSACAAILARKNNRHYINQRSSVQAAWKLDKPRSHRLWISFSAILFRQAVGVICNSKFARDEVVETLGVYPEKCAVVYNPVDCDKLQELSLDPLADPWFDSDSIPVLISIGSLSKVKDMGLLIRAFNLVRKEIPCNLLILGEGPERISLENIILSLGLEGSVRLPGFWNNPFPALSRSALFVSASLTEGCPNVILQALACEVPIVATNGHGGTSEILENGKWGNLVSCGDMEGLAASIIEVLNGEFVKNTRARAEQFSSATTFQEFLYALHHLGAEQSRVVS
jgi:glycosyltransferase involved in cell wall biosynthesis